MRCQYEEKGKERRYFIDPVKDTKPYELNVAGDKRNMQYE
jgi:hypothetical protein